MKMLMNKWENGETCWGKIEFPEFMNEYSGIAPMNVILDPDIGAETILCIIDRTEFAKDLAELSPFNMHLSIGLFRCEAGPLISCFFWLENPYGNDPYTSYENTLNPHDPNLLAPYWNLARQTHWHVFLIGPDNEELNWYEFQNVFKVAGKLKDIEKMVIDIPCSDFMEAKREYEQRNSMDERYRLATENH